MSELDSIATGIQTGLEDQGRKLAEFAQAEIQDFETQLRAAIDQMRDAKREILSIV